MIYRILSSSMFISLGFALRAEYCSIVVDMKVRSQNSVVIREIILLMRRVGLRISGVTKKNESRRPQQVPNENPTSNRDGGNAISRHAQRCLIDWLRWQQC